MDTNEKMTPAAAPIFYECGICDCYHRWTWNGDCREDGERFTLDQIPESAEIRSMEERITADAWLLR